MTIKQNQNPDIGKGLASRASCGVGSADIASLQAQAMAAKELVCFDFQKKFKKFFKNFVQHKITIKFMFDSIEKMKIK